MKRFKDYTEIAIVGTLIMLMSLPVLIVCLCIWPIQYLFDLRLQQKESDKFNS